MSGLDNVALTAEASAQAEALKPRLGLREAQDVIRLGVALALREKLSAEAGEKVSYTGINYRTDALDPDHHLRRAIRALYPTEVDASNPDEVLRVLMTRGVLRLAEELDQGRADSLADIVRPRLEEGQAT